MNQSTQTQEIAEALSTGNYNKALALLLQWEASEPDPEKNRQVQIAYCLIQLENFDQAEETLHTVLEQQPNHQRALSLLQEIERRPVKFQGEQAKDSSKSLLPKKNCTHCGKQVSKEFARCPFCKHWFIGAVVKKAFLYAGLPLLFLTVLRYVVQAYLLPEGNSPGAEDVGWSVFLTVSLPWFVVLFLVDVGCLMLSVFSLNVCLADKRWYEEWQLDLGASFLAVTGLVISNFFARVAMSILPLFIILFLVIQFMILWLFFQRGFIQTVLMYLLFISYKALFLLLIYALTGVMWLPD